MTVWYLSIILWSNVISSMAMTTLPAAFPSLEECKKAFDNMETSSNAYKDWICTPVKVL